MSLLKRVNEYQSLVREMEVKIKELNTFKEMYLECSQKLITKDAKLVNQQQAIDNTKKTLERLTKENESLKSLLVSEWNV